MKRHLLDLARRVVPGSVKQRLRAVALRRHAAAQIPAQLAAAQHEQGETIALDCRLCGQAAAPHWVLGHVSPTQEGDFSSRDQRLVQYDACEAIYLDPFPTREDMPVLYEGAEAGRPAREELSA